MNLYLGLIHHPIKDKAGEIITTSVTNLDIHDISRSCRTFGVSKYFIVTPIKAQKTLVERITGHWKEDRQADYNPDRFSALALSQVSESFEQAVEEITRIEGQEPHIVATGANFTEEKMIEPCKVSKLLDTKPVFLLFGTGWGLHHSILTKVDDYLMPIYGNSHDGYNHLSVRSAVAIYLNQIACSQA